MNSTTYAKRTQYKPIDIFFRGVVDAKSKAKKVVLIDAFQVLNDRYLGRMSVVNYFAIAENSVRINELNIIALEELKNYDLVMRQSFLIPDNLTYCLPVSTRFLENEKDFAILVDTLKDNKYKKSNLVLSFFANSLIKLDSEGRKRYLYLRRMGFKTSLAGFNEDYNSIEIFAELTFDYLRVEAQYFEATPKKKAVLQMLVKFCNASKIGLIMEGVDSPAQLARFKRDGVKYVTGRAVSKLSRWVTNEFLGLQDPKGDKLEAYLAKLQKDLDAKDKEVLKELEELRQASLEKQRAEGGEGVMPASPRPELAKSPYQVRLEQQRQRASKIVLDDIEEQEREEEEMEAESEASAFKQEYEGDVQSALALSYAYENKGEGNAPKKDKQLTYRKDEQEQSDVASSEDTGVSAPFRPADEDGNSDPAKSRRRKKGIRADYDKEAKLLDEFKGGNLFGGLGTDAGMKGFGVTLHVTAEEDEPEIVGHYNELGQWVDEDGNVYNGYFDADGNWVEYERFDANKEGHYNENGQWVDADGTIYDGYFDEEGRWIDYTYSDANGEIVDNGYFDDKIGKWVPFGYFDEQGNYHKF